MLTCAHVCMYMYAYLHLQWNGVNYSSEIHRCDSHRSGLTRQMHVGEVERKDQFFYMCGCVSVCSLAGKVCGVKCSCMCRVCLTPWRRKWGHKQPSAYMTVRAANLTIYVNIKTYMYMY